MRARMAATAIPFLLLAFLMSCRRPKPLHPPHNPTSVYDLFNQEAAPSDPADIDQYTDDLVGLIVSPGISDKTRQKIVDALADRLARAEKAARAGHGKLIPESDVVRAYNGLLAGVGAPPSFQAREETLHQFREYAASLHAFPALFTAHRNGTDCNPGEAVYLLYLLLSDDGKPFEIDVYSAWANQPGVQPDAAPQPKNQGSRGQFGYDLGRAQGLIYRYSLAHKHAATVALFKKAADTLGF